jgi:hypothetical protein
VGGSLSIPLNPTCWFWFAEVGVEVGVEVKISSMRWMVTTKNLDG